MFDPTTLVGLHTWLSLIALAAGGVIMVALARGRDLPGTALVFIVTAIATSVTGFPLPASGVLPSHIVGVLSLVALTVAVLARYRFDLTGRWRVSYVLSCAIAAWFLAFVAVVQAFLKVPSLNAVAPTGAEWPFLAAQIAVLVGFAVLTVLSLRTRSHIGGGMAIA